LNSLLREFLVNFSVQNASGSVFRALYFSVISEFEYNVKRKVVYYKIVCKSYFRDYAHIPDRLRENHPPMLPRINFYGFLQNSGYRPVFEPVSGDLRLRI